MSHPASSQQAAAMLTRLEQATNAHDLEGIVGCFAHDYRNETPAHPERSFVGQQQVRRNWDQILRLTPDIHMRVVRATADESVIWSELELSGTRPDGTPHLLRGVVIFGVENGLTAWARFYLEPVEVVTGLVDEAIQHHLAPGEQR